MNGALLGDLKKCIHSRSFDVFRRASDYCQKLIINAEVVIDEYGRERGLSWEGACFVAVGSVGRSEALQASDLDLIPIFANLSAATAFEIHDQPLRARLQQKLGVRVSKGADLTRFTDIDTLISSETIGGDRDDAKFLTKRILILSEGVKVGGLMQIQEVRRAIIDAYAGQERTSGRHVLSLCNDLARYYRTLCIEYKAKVDNEDKELVYAEY